MPSHALAPSAQLHPAIYFAPSGRQSARLHGRSAASPSTCKTDTSAHPETAVCSFDAGLSKQEETKIKLPSRLPQASFASVLSRHLPFGSRMRLPLPLGPLVHQQRALGLGAATVPPARLLHGVQPRQKHFVALCGQLRLGADGIPYSRDKSLRPPRHGWTGTFPAHNTNWLLNPSSGTATVRTRAAREDRW